MAGHGKYNKYLVAVILVISLSANLFCCTAENFERKVAVRAPLPRQNWKASGHHVFDKGVEKADTEGAMMICNFRFNS